MCAGLGSSIPPVYISEVAPEQVNGTLGSLIQLQITFGIFASYLMGIPLPTSDLSNDSMNSWWMAMFLFPVLTCLVQSVVLVLVYKFDTPVWLQSKNRDKEAERVLCKIYKSYIPETQNSQEMTENNESAAGLVGKDPSYKELFRNPKYRRGLILTCSLSALQQLSGINTFIFYSTRIFEETGGQSDQAIYFTAALGFFNMITTLSSLFFVDKLGRKLMLLQGSVGMCLCQLLLSYFDYIDAASWLKLSIMLVYVAFFESSLGPVLWIYCGEVMTDKGVGLAVAMNWIWAAIIGAVFPVMSSDSGLGVALTFLIFGCFCAFSFFYVLLFAVETKGKTKDSILNELKPKRLNSPNNY